MVIFGVVNIIFGLLAISPFFVSVDKKEKLSNIINWVGIIFLIWGLMGTVSSLLNIQIFSTNTLYWVLWVLGGIIGLALGVILVSRILTKKKNTGIENQKLTVLQKSIGILAIILGIIQLFVPSIAL